MASSRLRGPMRAALPAALAGLAACGSGTATSTGCPPPATTAAGGTTARAGVISVSADRRVAPRGGRVALAVTATGPARIAAPCTGPVSLVVADASGLHVFAADPPAVRGDPCGDVILAAGQTAAWQLGWDLDPTLPAGTYRLDVGVGDAPPVGLSVEVSGGTAGAPAC